MAVDHVTLTPLCEECNAVWMPGDTDRWRATWIAGAPDEVLVFYCAECWLLEFSDHDA